RARPVLAHGVVGGHGKPVEMVHVDETGGRAIHDAGPRGSFRDCSSRVKKGENGGLRPLPFCRRKAGALLWTAVYYGHRTPRFGAGLRRGWHDAGAGTGVE